MSTIKITNKLTQKIIEKPQSINKEVVYNGSIMITETDLKGVITFANRKFLEMTGYSKEELIGAPHTINRHPDMPKMAFKEMWASLKKSEPWHGVVKNLRKDGRYYWVEVWIQPKYDCDNTLTGYIAGRKVLYEGDKNRYTFIYKELLEKEMS